MERAGRRALLLCRNSGTSPVLFAAVVPPRAQDLLLDCGRGLRPLRSGMQAGAPGLCRRFIVGPAPARIRFPVLEADLSLPGDQCRSTMALWNTSRRSTCLSTPLHRAVVTVSTAPKPARGAGHGSGDMALLFDWDVACLTSGATPVARPAGNCSRGQWEVLQVNQHQRLRLSGVWLVAQMRPVGSGRRRPGCAIEDQCPPVAEHALALVLCGSRFFWRVPVSRLASVYCWWRGNGNGSRL